MRHYEIVLAVREELAEREPGVPHRKQEVAEAHTYIGMAARKDGQLDKAMRHDNTACMILADLLASEPGMAEYAIRLTNAEGQLASDYMSYKTSDTNESALEIFARARRRVADELNATPGQQNRIADIIAAIDKNVETLDRRGDDH